MKSTFSAASEAVAQQPQNKDSLAKDPAPLVSVVLPCLNEEKTIRSVIQEIHHAFRPSPYTYEVIVADNGSVDTSVRVAEERGAHVFSIPDRGYGAALLGGFQHARGTIIVFGDADLTYDFKYGPELVARLLRKDADLVIGSRMKGGIERGAMPGLHRYLGTPVLTQLINLLFKGHITDCNSGFRAFFRERLSSWQIKSMGMEFASEMIVNCLKSGGNIAEIPISLRKDAHDRTPHLSTWRDGMRHLLFILSRAPHGFTYTGVAILLISLFVALPSIFIGPSRLGPFAIFDFHSLILATLAALVGTQAISYGLLLDSESKHPLRINRWLLNIHEVWLLQILSGLVLMIFGFVGFIGFTWFRHGFNNLHYLRGSLALLYMTVVIGNLGLGLFISQVHRRL